MTGYGNKSFEEKRDRKSKDGKRYIGYNNGLEINKSIADKNSWSIDDIKQRTEMLADEFVKVYEFPGI